MRQGLQTATDEATIAVFGTGSIGMQHLRALSRVQALRGVAVPVRAERAEALAAKGVRTAPDVDAAVRQGAMFAIIATETHRHMEDARAALEREMDVLVEKPLASDAAAARQLSQQADDLRRNLFVGCVLRFSESLNIARALLERVGRLHAVRIECQSYLPRWRPQRPYRQSYSARADEGGVLRDLIHEIDYAGWLFGWPQAVQARVRNLGRLGIAAEEIAELSWETRGCLISIALDYLTQPPRRRLRASGARGTLEWDGIAQTVTVCEGEATQTLNSLQSRDEMFAAQAEAFVRACRGHVDERLATAQDGLKALAVCEAARQAANARREEAVDYS